MKNFGQMMKQAQQMQAKMAEMQAQLETIEMTGMAGGGMVGKFFCARTPPSRLSRAVCCGGGSAGCSRGPLRSPQ